MPVLLARPIPVKERTLLIPEVAQAKAGDTIRAKWLFDGCTTLADAAQRARDAADALQSLHDGGWTLAEPVSDDYGTLVDPTGGTGEMSAEDTDEV